MAWSLPRSALALAGAFLFVSCSAIPVRDEDGAVVKPGDLSVFDLADNDCFESSSAAPTGANDKVAVKVEVVPCTYRHHYRVVGIQEIGVEEFPGREELATTAEELCEADISSWISDDVVFEPLLPTPESWTDEEDREIVCVIRDDTGMFGRDVSVEP